MRHQSFDRTAQCQRNAVRDGFTASSLTDAEDMPRPAELVCDIGMAIAGALCVACLAQLLLYVLGIN